MDEFEKLYGQNKFYFDKNIAVRAKIYEILNEECPDMLIKDIGKNPHVRINMGVLHDSHTEIFNRVFKLFKSCNNS